MKGTFTERPKRVRAPLVKSNEDAPKKKKKSKEAKAASAEQPPNQILFLTNLPEETNDVMLGMLFNQ